MVGLNHLQHGNKKSILTNQIISTFKRSQKLKCQKHEQLARFYLFFSLRLYLQIQDLKPMVKKNTSKPV